jgi:thiamine biosynthesis lipoprotein
MSARAVFSHTAQVMGTTFSFRLCPPPGLPRRDVGEALAAAVGELRAVDLAFSPYRTDSLVSRLRRGELAPGAAAPLAEVVARCDLLRSRTDGWFDAWAVPGGFDPSGLVKGWAIERAAALLVAAGLPDVAVNGGGDIAVRGSSPHGGPWRVGVRHPGRPDAVVMVLELTDAAVATSGSYERGGHVVDPHTGLPATRSASATVVGPDLGTADALATALYAAGRAGLSWFPTEGYDALLVDAELTGTFTDGIARRRVPAGAAA